MKRYADNKTFNLTAPDRAASRRNCVLLGTQGRLYAWLGRIHPDEKTVGTYAPPAASASWSSYSPSIASIQSAGQVKGVSGGTATIAAAYTGDTWRYNGSVCIGSPVNGGASGSTNVYDFSIVPGSSDALCDGQIENVIYTSSFNCVPSGSCYASPPPASYCSATSSSGIEIQVGYPVYNVNAAGQLTCQVNFFTTSGGTITPTLTVKYGGTTQTQSKSLETPISCP